MDLRRRSDAGFGLLTALMVMFALTALGAFGVGLARQEMRAQVRSTTRTLAFYAAETGLARGMSNWNRPDVPGMGDTWLVDEGTLPGGASYVVHATQLDNASTVYALYAIRARGRTRNGVVRAVGLLAATVPFGSPITAALKSKDQVRVRGQAHVDGWDSIPPAWLNDCPPEDDGLPGVEMTDMSKMSKSGGAQVDGNPPQVQNTDTTGWFNFGDVTYEEMTTYADYTLPGGTSVSGSDPAPSLNADGTCNTSDNTNWGDPLNAGQPCSAWFPIIHVTGNFRGEGSGAGQGILLVDGDATFCGGFGFYGPVVIRGAITSCGSGFKIFGGVVSGSTDIDPTGGMFVGDAQIQYGACVIQRALSRSRGSKPKPLIDRGWYSGR
jgi:hypothetical protein